MAQGFAPAAAPMPGAGAAEGQEVEATEGKEPANEQEQELLDKFVGGVMDVIYPPQAEGGFSPQVVDDLKGNVDPEVLKIFAQADPPIDAKNPAELVAVVAITLLIAVDQQMNIGPMIAEPQEGIDATAIMMEAGQTVIEALVEVAEAAKIHDFSQEEIDGAALRAADLYRTAAETMGLPGYNKEALTAAFAELVEADKAGTLDKVLPGLPGGAPLPEKG